MTAPGPECSLLLLWPRTPPMYSLGYPAIAGLSLPGQEGLGGTGPQHGKVGESGLKAGSAPSKLPFAELKDEEAEDELS